MVYILNRTHTHIVQTGSCTHVTMTYEDDMKAAIAASLEDASLEDVWRLSKRLDDRLKSRGLTRVSVPGDGNCLFTAFGKEVQCDAKQLRQKAVAFIRTHEELFKSLNGDEESLSSYCDRMSEDGVYGDMTMIIALSKIFRRPVMIILPYGDDTLLGYEVFSPRDTVTIAYNGKNHYDGVVPLQVDTSPQDQSSSRASHADMEKIPRILVDDLLYSPENILPEMFERLEVLKKSPWWNRNEIKELEKMIALTLE